MSVVFETVEFIARIERAQHRMADAAIDVLLLTTHADFFYFTGYLTRFWESPTRPWFLLIPQTGEPIAVIPTIGKALMAKTHVQEIRTWTAPDLTDDGVTLLADAVGEFGSDCVIGIPDGHETHLRMPVRDFERLKKIVMHRDAKARFTGDNGILRSLRMVKSPAEVEMIAASCAIANRAFARLHEIAGVGIGLDRVFRDFQRLCLEEGADFVPYLAGGAGALGYDDVISPVTERPLEAGDVLMLDTGLVRRGYFCDFDRNVALGTPASAIVDAHDRLIEAAQVGFEAAKPGALASDLFHAMDEVLVGGKATMDNGRLGHGLGISLTEWPSLIPTDHTVLEPGFVLTLEPGIATSQGNMLVHEENIVITDTGARYLSDPQTSLPVLTG